jgi:hypothetical protein
MAIILELQEEALKSDADILSLLRKSSLIARKLSLKEFQEWINNELNGYKAVDKLPEYRKITGELKGWNPVNGWIPVMLFDNKTEEILTSRGIFDSIPSLNSLLSDSNKNFSISMNANANSIISKNTGFTTTYNLFISPNSISNIIEQVKNKVLDWAITLEENGILGEGLRFTTKEKEIAKNEPQIVNYINNFYGDVSDSQLQEGTTNSKQKLMKNPSKSS